MQSQQTILFYQQFISNIDSLAKGYQLIKEYLSIRENRNNTLLHLLDENVPIIILISNVYSLQIYPNLQEEEKVQTRQFLLQILLKTITSDNNRKNEQNVLILINKLHDQEGYESWVQLYLQLIKYLESQPNILGNIIIKVIKNADSRAHYICRYILKYIINNNAQHKTQIIIQILYYSIKSISHLVGTDDQVIQEYYLPYYDSIMKYCWQNVKHSISTMKYSLKLLTVIFSDMEPQKIEVSEQILKQVPFLMMQVCQQYLNNIQNANYSNLDSLQQVQQSSSSQTINVIFHQGLSLVQAIMQNYDDNMQTIPIMYCSILGTVVDKKQYGRWIKESQQYYLALQYEGQVNLRNRCIQMISNLLQANNKHKSLLDSYITRVISASQTNSIAPIEQHLKEKNINLKLYGQYILHQQSTYFILTSFAQDLFNTNHKQQLIKYLYKRVNITTCPIIKIVCMMIIIAQTPSIMLQEQSGNMVNYLLNIAQNNVNSLGILLSVCKGIAKCCTKNTIINKHIPSQFISIILNSVLMKPQLDPDCDAISVILQFILKLSDRAQNIEALRQIINQKYQKHLITNFMHDGMVASSIVQIMGRIGVSEIVQQVYGWLLNGYVSDERHTDMILAWKNNKAYNIIIQHEHIIVILQRYKGSKRYLISKIVKCYLQELELREISTQVRQKLSHELSTNAQQQWYLYMMKNNLVEDSPKLLGHVILNLTNQITSPYQFQSKLTLPYYMGIHHTQQFIQFLNSIHIYQSFIQKLFKYSALFKGDHLRIVTSVFFLKLVSFEVNYKYRQRVVGLIQGYGGMQTEEWQDQEQQMGQNGIIERLMDKKMVNEQVQTQFQSVFKELAWAHEQVKKQLGNIK